MIPESETAHGNNTEIFPHFKLQQTFLSGKRADCDTRFVTITVLTNHGTQYNFFNLTFDSKYELLIYIF